MADTASLAPFLDVFPEWLRTLGEDARELGATLAPIADEETARYTVAGLNYIFKSLDLIPDGIDDLGFCDDAFVIRVAAKLANGGEGILGRLAGEASEVESFLGEDYALLVTYVEGLKKGAARGRTVEDIVGDETVRATFLDEVGAWAAEYQVPAFTKDVKTLIKLKAFLSAKLG